MVPKKKQIYLSIPEIFDSIVYIKVLGQLKKDSRINVGFAENGYRLWDQKTKKIQISRDVVLFERNLINRMICYHNLTALIFKTTVLKILTT